MDRGGVDILPLFALVLIAYSSVWLLVIHDLYQVFTFGLINCNRRHVCIAKNLCKEVFVCGRNNKLVSAANAVGWTNNC